MPDTSKVKLGLLVLGVIVLLMLSSRLFSGPFLNLNSTFRFIFKSHGLSKIVQDNLAGQKGEYAVYIEDLTDGEVYSLKSSDTFPAASLYKLYLLAAVIKEIENGPSTGSGLKMESEISASKKHLTEVLGEVDFGYEDTPDTIVYSVQEALERVGRISDNFAAIMLVEKVGWEKVQQMVDSLEAGNTSIKDPITTSASDIALFFKKLHQKQVVSEMASNQIEELLLLSQINNRIPAKLPQDTKTVHKTGELAGIRHDGGIVYLTDQSNGSDRAYVIVLLSKDLQFEDEGVQVLANISKDVFEYFRSK